MTCPVCGEKTKVTNSQADSDCVYRERQCVVCKHKFYTEEVESEDRNTINQLAYNHRIRSKEGEHKL